MLFAGFLMEDDVTRSYHVAVPYISNPYQTMDQTSREIARRYAEWFAGKFLTIKTLIFTISFISSSFHSPLTPLLHQICSHWWTKLLHFFPGYR